MNYMERQLLSDLISVNEEKTYMSVSIMTKNGEVPVPIQGGQILILSKGYLM